MPTTLITEYLTALRDDDLVGIARIEAQAAEFDTHNPFGPRLLDELAELYANRYPQAA